jgi:hypothetical protein
VCPGDHKSLDCFDSLAPEEKIEVLKRALELSRESTEHMAQNPPKVADLRKGTERAFDSQVDWFLPIVAHAAEAILQSQLVSAYTALEISTTDLWEKALNVCHTPFALAAIENPLSKNGNEDLTTYDKKGLSLIRDTILKAPQVISGAGTIIKLSNKFNFDSLEGIRIAYQCAFKDSSISESEKIFELPEFKEMKVLEATRNVLVHKAGKVDDRFIEKSEYDSHRSEYEKCGLRGLRPGDKIPINGEMVKGLIESTIKWANALLAFVEKRVSDELAKHKGP